MSRILEIWAKRGLVPDRYHAMRIGEGAGEVALDIEAGAMDAALVARVADEIRAVIGVRQVLVADKRPALRARDRG